MHKLYTDGSQLFNVKKAGIGGYITDSNDKVIQSFHQDISDNPYRHLHETIALVEGLKMALDMGLKEIICYMDDEGLSKILQRKQAYSENNPFLPEVMDLVEQFTVFSVEHVRRDYNSKADKLSKKYLEKIEEENIQLKSNVILHGTPLSPTVTNIREYEGHKYFVNKNLFSNQHNPEQKSLFKQFGHNSTICFIDGKEIEQGYLISFSVKKEGKVTYSNSFEIPSHRIANCIKFIARELSNLQEDNIWLDFNRPLRSILQNPINAITAMQPIFKQQETALCELADSLQKFSRVVIGVTPERELQETNTGKKKVKFKTDKTGQFLSAMKLLGDNLYVIGTNPDIEERFKVLPEKKGDVAEIQKKYFICYRDAIVRGRIQKMNESANTEKLDLEKIEQQTKDDLLSQGIKLRF